jgi:aminopeptidase N
MLKPCLFVFLTIFLFINTIPAVFAQCKPKKSVSQPLYSDTAEALHYDIHLTHINLTDKSVQGYTTVTLLSKNNNQQIIKLELASLIVDSVFINDVKTSNFERTTMGLNIHLSSAIDSGAQIVAGIYYHGIPFVDPSGWGGFHFYGNYALNLGVGFDAIPHNLGKAWFACIDDFHDRALYDVYLTVSNNYKAVSGGQLVSVTPGSNNTSTWHWHTNYTLPTYLISATTGPYELVEDAYTNGSATIPITYYCRPADTLKVAGTFTNLKNIVNVFESKFGVYPFERIGYVATPGNLGAMEHASNISLPFSGWPGNTSQEWWYAHELSHMWFGDKVTCASAEDMWLNEGWAVWCESFYREGIYGKEAYKDNMRAKLKEVLQNTHILDNGYYAVYGIPQTLTYGNTVYQKGGQVTHTLRGYMGDSLFFGGVKAYLEQYAYNYASTYDLRDFLQQYSNMDLGPFFDAWVFSPGFPHFSIDSVTGAPAPGGWDVTVFVRQKLIGATQFANANHLEMRFLYNNWQSIDDSMVFSGEYGSKTFHLPAEPVAVFVDPAEKISDATTDLTKKILTTGEYVFDNTLSKIKVNQIADSALVRITHNWVPADSMKSVPAGLRFSDNRYWTVEGIFPAGFISSGSFAFHRTLGLDNTLITHSKDSLVLYYRKGTGSEWMPLQSKKTGTWVKGDLTIDTLRTGEYVMAVWDHLFLDLKHEGAINTGLMKVYPNPGSSAIHVDFTSNENLVLNVYDTAGKILDKQVFAPGETQYVYSPEGVSGSVVLMRLTNAAGEIYDSQKVIICK